MVLETNIAFAEDPHIVNNEDSPLLIDLKTLKELLDDSMSSLIIH